MIFTPHYTALCYTAEHYITTSLPHHTPQVTAPTLILYISHITSESPSTPIRSVLKFPKFQALTILKKESLHSVVFSATLNQQSLAQLWISYKLFSKTNNSQSHPEHPGSTDRISVKKNPHHTPWSTYPTSGDYNKHPT